MGTTRGLDYVHDEADRLKERIAEITVDRLRAQEEARHARHLGIDLEGPARAAEREAERLREESADLDGIVQRVLAGFPYFEREGFEAAIEACGEVVSWTPVSERPAPGVVLGYDSAEVRIPLEVQREYGKAVSSGLFEGFVVSMHFDPDEDRAEGTSYLLGTIKTPCLAKEPALFLVGQWRRA